MEWRLLDWRLVFWEKDVGVAACADGLVVCCRFGEREVGQADGMIRVYVQHDEESV